MKTKAIIVSTKPTLSIQTAHEIARTQTTVEKTHNQIVIFPTRITTYLFLTVFILALAHLVGMLLLQYLPSDNYWLGEIQESYLRLFSLDGEANIPSWYSSSALLCCSLLLAAIAAYKKAERDLYTRHWTILAIIFLCLSVDEAALLHEMTIKPLQMLLQTTGLLYYAWVIPGTLFVAVLGLVYLKFIYTLPPKTRRLFITAALLFVTGAIVVEAFSGDYAEIYGESGMVYNSIIMIEELFEMMGVVIFIHALLDYMVEVMQLADNRAAAKHAL